VASWFFTDPEVPLAPVPLDTDAPRAIPRSLTVGDRVFVGGARGVGITVLILIGSIGVFLGAQALPTLHRYGWRYFTEAQWIPERNVIGISAVLVGTV
jgi:phosphate transport system permease protein